MGGGGKNTPAANRPEEAYKQQGYSDEESFNRALDDAQKMQDQKQRNSVIGGLAFRSAARQREQDAQKQTEEKRKQHQEKTLHIQRLNQIHSNVTPEQNSDVNAGLEEKRAQSLAATGRGGLLTGQNQNLKQKLGA